jgi:hypothetical protein
LPNSNALKLLSKLAANGAALCSREYFHSKRLARRHNDPYDPRELVGERHRDQSRGFAREKRDQPIAQGTFAFTNHARANEVAPSTSSRLMVRLPCLLMEPSFSLPPLEFCRGVAPSEAEKESEISSWRDHHRF